MEDADVDVEFGDSAGERRTSWLKTLAPNTLRLGRAPSGSAARSRSVALELPSVTLRLMPIELHRQESLILLLVGDQELKGSIATSCAWYSEYLQTRFRSHWHLLAAALSGLQDDSKNPRPGDLVIVYDFLITVARLLKTRRDLALVEVVDELDNKNMLKPQLDEERAIPNQIVFAALGWLSMLYEAVSRPKADKLEVTKTSTSACGYRNPLITKKYSSFKQGFDYIDLPLYSLLSRFGDLIPEAKLVTGPNAGHMENPAYEVIMVQSVCFNTLHHLAELKIEWVTSLALHLELDSAKKTLKLFQFPSFCRMMYVERKNNILSRLLNDHTARNHEDARSPDVLTDEFFQEILLSYRVLFGQDERSWRAFSRLIPVWEEQGAAKDGETKWNFDPMLTKLCGHSSSDEECRKFYEDIDANLPATYYDPSTEFQFLGKRLLELQQFVKQHQPQNIRSLFNDRRDVASWYNLLNTQILICFAVVTVFMMILGLIFQGWQIMLTKQQLSQGQQ